MSSWYIPRRTFLKGVGSSILLPFLEAMAPTSAMAADISSPRFVAFFMSLGIYGLGYDPTKNNASRYYYAEPYMKGGLGAWLPNASGSLSTAALKPILQPLESMKQKITLVSGLGTLASDEAFNSTNHSAATTAWMTSAWASRAEAARINVKDEATGSKHPANNTPPDSLDQYIANAIGLTPGSTLVLNPVNGNYSESQQGGHGGYISYNSKLSKGGSSIVPKVADPMRAFNNLFGSCSAANAPRTGTKSILDYVMTSIGEVQKKIGVADKARLDSYLQNIRDLEVKLHATQTACPTAPTPSPAFNGTSRDWVTTMNLMVDVIALAVGSGAMPVASLMTDVEAGNDPYAARVSYLSNFIGLSGKKVAYHAETIGTHFDIAHVEADGANTQAVEEHIAYSQMNITFVQRLMQKLNSMPVEPNGMTPLDNTLILAGCCHSDSGHHNTHNLPILLAGGNKFGLNQGQHVAFPMFGDVGDLYYTISKAMGIAGTSFNGHSKLLAGVFKT